MIVRKFSATVFTRLVNISAVLSMKCSVFSATLLTTLDPVLVIPVIATFAVSATAEKTLKNGRLSAAVTGGTSCGAGFDCANAMKAHNTKIDTVVFMLMILQLIIFLFGMELKLCAHRRSTGNDEHKRVPFIYSMKVKTTFHGSMYDESCF